MLLLNRYHEGALLQKINPETDIAPVEPSTVKDNVKNVGEIKKAAERGFNATYADCIHRISEQVPQELRPWQTKVRGLQCNILLINMLEVF